MNDDMYKRLKEYGYEMDEWKKGHPLSFNYKKATNPITNKKIIF